MDTSSSTPSPQQLADRWLELWNGNYSDVNALIAEEFQLHTALPDGGDGSAVNDSASLVEWIKQVRATIPDLHYSVQVGPLVDGDHIALRWRAEGAYVGGMPGASAPSGTPIDFTGTDLLRIVNGHLVEYWLNCDVHRSASER